MRFSNTALRWAVPCSSRQSQQEERAPREMITAYRGPAEKTLLGIGPKLNLESV